jgi:hypothetical protein
VGATTLRHLETGDAVRAAMLAEDALRGSPYLDRAREILRAACAGDPEWRATGAFDPVNGALRAVASFGPVSGASDAWRVGDLLFARDSASRDVADPLIQDVVTAVQRRHARLVVAEMPADETIGFSITVLRANGFRQEARIPDFYRDGVAQLFLRRDFTSGRVP